MTVKQTNIGNIIDHFAEILVQQLTRLDFIFYYRHTMKNNIVNNSELKWITNINVFKSIDKSFPKSVWKIGNFSPKLWHQKKTLWSKKMLSILPSWHIGESGPKSTHFVFWYCVKVFVWLKVEWWVKFSIKNLLKRVVVNNVERPVMVRGLHFYKK